MTLFQKKFPATRRLALIVGLALLVLAPVVGAFLQPDDLSARPLSAETSPLTVPQDDGPQDDGQPSP
ncbi:MAG: hypothetical protein GYB53_02440 [Rhodobacteraceae bacterium]|nr:hypothetical protein [Paracoccaceae bacterium]MBR9820198.1 hypothetical protein [Paracoccaceae bacterium]